MVSLSKEEVGGDGSGEWIITYGFPSSAQAAFVRRGRVGSKGQLRVAGRQEARGRAVPATDNPLDSSAQVIEIRWFMRLLKYFSNFQPVS